MESQKKHNAKITLIESVIRSTRERWKREIKHTPFDQLN